MAGRLGLIIAGISIVLYELFATQFAHLFIQEAQIMRCDSDSGKKLIKSMVLRTADRQGMC